jgi:hypothetical protein
MFLWQLHTLLLPALPGGTLKNKLKWVTDVILGDENLGPYELQYWCILVYVAIGNYVKWDNWGNYNWLSRKDLWECGPGMFNLQVTLFNWTRCREDINHNVKTGWSGWVFMRLVILLHFIILEIIDLRIIQICFSIWRGHKCNEAYLVAAPCQLRPSLVWRLIAKASYKFASMINIVNQSDYLHFNLKNVIFTCDVSGTVDNEHYRRNDIRIWDHCESVFLNSQAYIVLSEKRHSVEGIQSINFTTA